MYKPFNAFKKFVVKKIAPRDAVVSPAQAVDPAKRHSLLQQQVNRDLMKAKNQMYIKSPF